MYNKAELVAMQMIAGKMNWHKPVDETVETIYKMVSNQQALELDCVGECDGFEETLLSIALWDADKIGSTLFINDYHALVNYKYNLFLEDMGITEDDYKAMVDYYVNIQPEAFAAEYEEYLNEYYSDYDAEIMRDVMWMNKNC
jgi:hypothetical protein